MSKYDVLMAPLEFLILGGIRKKLMPKAYGNVLEIGFATGVNMKYYDMNKIQSFHALDTNEDMKYFDNVRYHTLSAEALPFEDKSFDTIVLTLALCSIEAPEKALKEIGRVLKDDGQYLFIEHQRPKTQFLYHVFKKINPTWKKYAGGCQIILETDSLIKSQGFILDKKNINVFHYGIAHKI
ncbi:MAG: class I SAM-dependent methyltransferase [Erysipelothrix sp.]|nr:class I SAM-dependent methyltransferase [Erysipelothrix sp.]